VLTGIASAGGVSGFPRWRGWKGGAPQRGHGRRRRARGAGFLSARVDARALRPQPRRERCELDSVAAPAGEMNRGVGPGWPGILLHEASAMLERTSTARRFRLQRRMGQRVASELCTVIDDGTLERRGSLNGMTRPSDARHVLIENGVLTATAGQALQPTDESASTGSGRVRATRISPCRAEQHLHAGWRERSRRYIRWAQRPLILRQLRRRPVDITSGNFVFSASE